MVIIFVIAVVAFLVTLRMKNNNSYVFLDFDSLCTSQGNCTGDLLEKVRECTHDYTTRIDVFESDAIRTMITNVGIVSDGGTTCIPYQAIANISEPTIALSKSGKWGKIYREVTVQLKNGISHQIIYANLKGSLLRYMLININETGYPLPEYKHLESNIGVMINGEKIDS